MSRPRENFSGLLLVSMAAAGTTWAAMLSWRGFTQEAINFLAPLLFIGLSVALSGALARWLRFPGVLVVLVQLAISGMTLLQIITGLPLPIAGNWGEFTGSLRGAYDAAQTYAPPVPYQDNLSVAPLLLLGGLAAMLLVDFIACTLRRVPVAGLPLLTVYSVPVSLLDGGSSWWVFGLTALGFLSMIYLHEVELVSRWGRPMDDAEDAMRVGTGQHPELQPGRERYDVRTGSLRTNAVVIGAAATALAVLMPIGIPTLDLQVIKFGRGAGGDADINIDNPMVDLRRDLVRGPDISLIQVRTDDPNPSYLRISVLNRFTNAEWSPGDRDVPSSNSAAGEMPPLEGVADSVPRTEHDYEIEINHRFDSTWLPTQAPISQIEARGDWRYDLTTMDFIAGDDDLSTESSEYSLTAVDLDLDAARLASASDSTVAVQDEVLKLPDDTPDLVNDLAISVTEDADTRFDKAVALQRWFTTTGGFTYDIDRAPSGDGIEELEAFLSEGDGGRIGYCEQFTAAMAVMARSLGIPSRVAVGFLNPDPIGSDRYEYSAHDLHTWPELYFEGAGWVRFEPTPATRGTEAPSYTRGSTGGDVPQPDNTDTEAPSQAPQEQPSAAPQEQDLAEQDQQNQQDSAVTWWPYPLGAFVILALAVLALLPSRLRRRRREARLMGDAQDAWDELRATVVDLGRMWPGVRTPRQTRQRLVDWFGNPADTDSNQPSHRGAGLAPEATAALDRIVRELELSRYARSHHAEPGQLRDDVIACISALEAGATKRVRRRANWLPRSVTSDRGRVRGDAPTQADGSEALVEQL